METEFKVFFYACCKGDLEYVKLLVKPMYIAQFQDGNTAFCSTCWEGHLNIIKFLCEYDQSIIYQRDTESRSALYYATIGGHLECVKFLCSKLETPSLPSLPWGVELYACCVRGHIEIARYLLTRQPDIITYRNSIGRTIMHASVESGSLEMVKFISTICNLLESIDNRNRSPFFLSCLYGHVDIATFMLEHIPTLYVIKDDNNTTALFAGASNGHLDCVKLISRQNMSQIFVKNKSGQSPLYISCYNGHLHVAKYLYGLRLYFMRKTLLLAYRSITHYTIIEWIDSLQLIHPVYSIKE